MNKEFTSKIIGLALALLGLYFLYLHFNRDSQVKDYKSDHANITVIDLSTKAKPKANNLLIGGSLLFLSLVVIVLSTWDKSPLENEVQSFYTEREMEVANLIRAGKNNKEIAIELNVSLSTIKTHVSNIFRKSGVNSRSELLKSLKK